MDVTCAECGAPLPLGAPCRELLDRLLEVETRVLPGVGDAERAKRAHYFAVATYQAQHPSQVTNEGLGLLVAGLAEQAGPSPRPVQQLLVETRRLASGDRRVRRRALPGDRSHVPGWPTRWTTTVWDVGERPDGDYVCAVGEWARDTVADLARAGLPTTGRDAGTT